MQGPNSLSSNGNENLQPSSGNMRRRQREGERNNGSEGVSVDLLTPDVRVASD